LRIEITVGGGGSYHFIRRGSVGLPARRLKSRHAWIRLVRFSVGNARIDGIAHCDASARYCDSGCALLGE
jgi:hypothetical protein